MGIKQDYVNELNAIAARYGALEEETIRRSLAMLKDLRAQIAAELSTVEGWEAYRLKQLQANLARLIDGYQARMTALFHNNLADASRAGIASAADPLRKAGLLASFNRPTPSLVNVALDFSARLIQEITDEMRAKIDAQLRLAILGQKSPADAMRLITQELGIEARAGVWAKRLPPARGIAARAETIVRTEMGRLYNLSAYSQQQAIAAVVPGLLKSWLATGDTRTRKGHLRAHLEYKEHPIPYDKPFVIYDIDDKGRVKGRANLMYPKDPAAPGQYTINCRCKLLTIHPEVGRIGMITDARVQKIWGA